MADRSTVMTLEDLPPNDPRVMLTQWKKDKAELRKENLLKSAKRNQLLAAHQNEQADLKWRMGLARRGMGKEGEDLVMKKEKVSDPQALEDRHAISATNPLMQSGRPTTSSLSGGTRRRQSTSGSLRSMGRSTQPLPKQMEQRALGRG